MSRSIPYSRVLPILTATLLVSITLTYLGTTLAYAQGQQEDTSTEAVATEAAEQPAVEAPVADNIEVFDFGVLATLGGIVAIAVPLTSLAKRGAAKVPYLKDTPTVVYAWVIASGLTAISWWLGHLQVMMETPQDWFETLASVSITSSLVSVGTHGTLKNVLKTPASKYGAAASVVLVCCVFVMGGCATTVDADRAAAYSNTYGQEYAEALQGEFDLDELTDVEREGRLEKLAAENDRLQRGILTYTAPNSTKGRRKHGKC